MHLVYFDESGDDGYPNRSSDFFALTALYFDQQHWKKLFYGHLNFRRFIKTKYDIPVHMEIHTKNFILGKKPYHNMKFSRDKKIDLISDYCTWIAKESVNSGNSIMKIINCAIDKTKLTKPNVDVLNLALKYTIQRIENDMKECHEESERNYLILTDEGRLTKMRKTSRKIQRINYIPSRFNNNPYRSEIQYIIEDPLPKNSKDSYFIQIADFVVFIVSRHIQYKHNLKIPKKISQYYSHDQFIEWLKILKPSLNVKACRNDPYGIKIVP